MPEFLTKILQKNFVKNLIFITLLLASSFYYNYQEILTYRPVSIHQWRNCVSASMALNYYHEGEFLHPRTHNMQVDDNSSDITVTEFPILYYFIGMLYRVFGFHEFIYRLVNVLIGFTGLFFLFRLGLKKFNNTFYALVPPLLVFSSPIYAFYINNFIPDATSLSLVLIGFYFFYTYSDSGRTREIIFSLVFFALAGLIKTPAFLLFFAILGIFGLEWFFRVSFKKDRLIFKERIRMLLLSLLVMLITIAWYAYAKIYSDTHGGVVSPVEIRPIWRLSSDTISAAWTAVSERFRNGNYHSPGLIILMFGLIIHNLVFWKKYDRLLSWLVMLSFFGGICFSLLFFRSLRQHDYYQMNNLIILVLVSFNFFLYFRERFPRLYRSWISKSIVAILVLFLVFKCHTFLKDKYYGGWYMEYSTENYNYRYGEITPYLRSLGIERYDKVYVTYDPSINISLYLMDQKGFTDFFRKDRTFSQKVEFFSEKGLKYVLIGDYDTIDTPPEDIGLEKIGEYNGVGIYRTEFKDS